MTRLALIYAAGLVILLSIANAGGFHDLLLLVQRVPLLDKAIHFVMYGLLAWLVIAALSKRGWPVARAIAIGGTSVLIVSTIDEVSNRFIPVREWSWGDLAANYLGVLGLGVLPLWMRLRKSRAGVDDSAQEPLPARTAAGPADARIPQTAAAG